MNMLTAKHCCVACLLATAATVHAQASVPAPAARAGSEASTTFKRWDKNRDSALSVAEFGTGWQEIQAANTLRILHDNFVAKDTDRTGTLGQAEYLRLDLVQKAGASSPPMTTFDTDKNQSLDFKEYVGLVSSMVKP